MKPAVKDGLIAIMFFLILIIIAIILNLSLTKISRVDSERVFRDKADILNEETTYLDEEAIALNGNPVSSELRDLAINAFDQINIIRSQNGLNELIWDGNLETVANVRSKEICQNFSHTRPNGKPWYTVNSRIQGGENLAYGFSTSAEVIDAWMNSPTHKDNVLYSEFRTMAISVYKIDDTYYWAQEFGY